MFQKECPNCGSSFKSKDRRQNTCGAACSKEWRKKHPPVPRTVANLPTPPPVEATRQVLDLPPPDQLPAPYAKKVYEMWRSLTGDASTPSRIA